MSELINVKDKAPRIPCIAVDEYYQIFILRDMVTTTDENGQKEYYDGAFFSLKTGDFIEVDVEGKPAKITRKVKYWMQIPNVQEEKKDD